MEPKPSDAGPAVAGLAQTSTHINLRDAPAKSGQIVQEVTAGMAVRYYPKTERLAIDGFDWLYVETDTKSGWMARVWATWAGQFTPPGRPSELAVRRAVPWVDANAADAPDGQDCGIAAVVMGLRYLAVGFEAPWLADVTIAQVAAKLGKANGLRDDDVVRAFALYGVQAVPRFDMTVETVKTLLNAGQTPLLLVQRGLLPALMVDAPNSSDAHWIVATGYGTAADGSEIVTVNDAAVNGGQHIALKASELQQALAVTSYQTKANTPFLGVEITQPPKAPPVDEDTSATPALVSLVMSVDEARQFSVQQTRLAEIDEARARLMAELLALDQERAGLQRAVATQMARLTSAA